jgi:type IV secretory pathway TraG/TraD family ATPase VirD4
MAQDFTPQKVLIDWKGNQAFTIADAQTGVAVFGATGSGKTSGPGRLFAHAYLKNGFGGLVLCAKVEERRQWEEWARATGRSADLVMVDAAGAARFNFLEWEATHAGQGAGFAINVVALLDEIASVSETGAQDGEGSAFFREAHRHLLINLVDLLLLAGRKVSLVAMRMVLSSAPLSVEQAHRREWQENSICWKLLRAAEDKCAGDQQALADFEEVRAYFEQDFPSLSDRTRSIIVLMFAMIVRPFVTRPLRRLFAEDTTVRPEDAFGGKIVIVDLPVQEYRVAGRMAAIAWKWCFQLAVMRREAGAGQRPVFLWADEAQNFITERDAEYQAVARSAGGCTVYLTQQKEGVRRVLRNDDATENLLANLQTKIFCQNTGATNTWASELLGERYVIVTTTNIGRSGTHTDPTLTGNPAADAGTSANINRAEQKRFYVEPAQFTTLRRGGAANDFHVEAVVYCGGLLFERDNELLPYKLLIFRQKA